jgi:uncharacterized membrane protein YbhN (UPF0104 family)
MKILIVIAKIVISLGLVWLVFRHIDLAGALALMRAHPLAMLGAILVFLAQAVLAAMRLPPVVAIYEERAGFWLSLRLWLICSFASQTMITFIAGDAIRVWLLGKSGVTLRTSTRAILFDRMFGLVVLLLLVLPSGLILLASYPLPPALRSSLIGLLLISTSALVGFGLSPVLLRLVQYLPEILRANRVVGTFCELLSIASDGFRAAGPSAQVALIGVFMHAMNPMAFYILLNSFGATIGFWPVMLVTFPVMLIALMPISFAGWGVREGGMVAGLGLFGIDPALALAASVAFGLSLLLSSLPGGALLLARTWGHQRSEITGQISERDLP